MATTIEKAKKGRFGAFEALFDAHKAQMIFLAETLTGDPETAQTIVFGAVKDAFGGILSDKILTEDAFAAFVKEQTISRSKTAVRAKDPKAFSAPANKSIANVPLLPVIPGAVGADAAVQQLPPLWRFAFVLHDCADYSEQTLVKLLNIDRTTVEYLLQSKAEMLSRLDGNVDVQSFADALEKKQTEAAVSDALGQAVEQEIKRICAPFRAASRKKTVKGWLIAFGTVLALCLIVGVSVLIASNTGTKSTSSDSSSDTDTYSDEEISAAIDSESQEWITDVSGIHTDYYADIEIQDYGTITVALDAQIAPKTVENFVSLAESGFYDGLTFHRIMEGFMMQGGDPQGTGSGGSDQTIVGEFNDNGHANFISHTRGAISMARSTAYDSASSQFFIVHEDSTFLDGQYAAFGYVTEGMEVVDAVCSDAQPTDNNGTISADEQPIINKVTIRKA